MIFKPLKNYLPVLCLILILISSSLPSAHSSEHNERYVLGWSVMPVDDPDHPQYAHWYDFIKLGERRARLKPGREVRDIHPQGDYYPHVSTIGRGLEITVPRAFARPGDRFVEVFVEIESGILEDNEHVHLEAALFGTGSAQPVTEREITPGARVGLLKVDMRRNDLSEARLQVSLYASDARLAVAEVGLSAQPAERPLNEGEQIGVDIDTPEGIDRDEAVALSFGVPFPAGSLWDPRGVRLVNDRGEAVASQSEVTGRWSQEGAVKWLRFDAVAVPDEGLKIEMSPQQEGRIPARPLSVEESDESVIVETGAARYELSTGASPIKSIGQNGREVATSAGAKGLYVIDQEGRLGVSSADGQTMEVESAGPTAACVRFEGYYRTEGGEPLARHITRVELFAGLPQAKVTHTLVLSRDSNEVWFRDIGWELAVAPGAGAAGVFGVSHAEQDRYVEVSLGEETPVAYILQEEHLRFGKGDNHFEVVSLDSEGGSETVHEGERMGDWSALHGEAGGLMGAVRDAALQHPKEFEVSADRLNIRLFSDRAGEELDFRAETLVKKWGLPELYESRRPGVTVTRERIAEQHSNAIGWAKTHELTLSPLKPLDAGDAAARAVREDRRQPAVRAVRPD